MQKYLLLDYETYSEADLKKVGGYNYAKHPTTEILCCSYFCGTWKEIIEAVVNKTGVKTITPFGTEWYDADLNTGSLEEFENYLYDKSIILVAHNASFEQVVTRFVFHRTFERAPIKLPSSRWLCTATLASVNALPRSLDGVTNALGLRHVKDTEGHRLMLSWCKPRKPSKNNPSKRYMKNFTRLVQYCESDIYAEGAALLKLKPMTNDERKLWVFDQAINWSGVTIDTDLVKKCLALIKENRIKLMERFKIMTGGKIDSPYQKAKILDYLKSFGLPLLNLQAKTVSVLVASKNINENIKEFLHIYRDLNKTSLKKYDSFLTYANSEDQKVRFPLNFHATVHGRWNATGLQFHNMPRPSVKFDKDSELNPLELAVDLIKSGCSLETFNMFFDNNFTTIMTSLLRSMIVADPGNELFITDFAAIEARVLFWMSKHKKGIEAFEQKTDMYVDLASVIFNKPKNEISKAERFVGKQAFLASGYGAGWKKFQATCEQLGQPVDTNTAKKAIDSYRKFHRPVTKLWYNLENAAIKAIETRQPVTVNYVTFKLESDFLRCYLPSGRPISYYKPKVKYEPNQWGDVKAVVYHWTVDSLTRKWLFVPTWGGVFTQNCVGGISRDLLAQAMIRVQNVGYDVRLTIHDELISQRKKGEGNIEEYNFFMKQVPEWCKGCPIDVEGFVNDRYLKR